MQYSFISDNNAAAHPAVLEQLVRANEGQAYAYGEDHITAEACQLMKSHFGDKVEVLFTATGTASNVICLKTLLEPYEAVICARSAHLNVDECGAPEALIGTKLIDCETQLGKLTPEHILGCFQDYKMVHRLQPKVVSISQCTEWGTVYTIEELQAIADVCHQHNLFLHVDGARLANAAVKLGVSLGEVCLNGGIDMLSFGGTKNGLMGAEAVVLFNPALKMRASFLHKQMMQLSSKMRFISAQFIALLSSDLWKKNAEHANKMAKRLADQIADVVTIVKPVESNVIFAQFPQEIIEPLQAQYPFAVWESEKRIVRLMTAFDTPESAVDGFAAFIKEKVHVNV